MLIRRSFVFMFLIPILALMLSACAEQAAVGGGPRLVSEATLAPGQGAATVPFELPTLFPDPAENALSPTPSPRISDTPLPTLAITSELVSPLERVTVEADYVLVTPTLPPSKTPTSTPTATTSPTITPTPSLTATSTATQPVFPTSVVIPVTAPVIQPIDQLCDSNWEFIQPPPQGCPIAPSTVVQGVYQTFERGHMIWAGAPWTAIFVLYEENGIRSWQRYSDTFAEGTGQFPNPPWKDPFWDTQAPAGLYQPVRGFGKLWRNEDNDPFKADVRGRIGWGTMEFEKPLSLRLQMRQDGTQFLTLLENGQQYRVFQLTPGGGGWQLYASSPF